MPANFICENLTAFSIHCFFTFQMKSKAEISLLFTFILCKTLFPKNKFKAQKKSIEEPFRRRMLRRQPQTTARLRYLSESAAKNRVVIGNNNFCLLVHYFQNILYFRNAKQIVAGKLNQI